jgi:hypothetical protein
MAIKSWLIAIFAMLSEIAVTAHATEEPATDAAPEAAQRGASGNPKANRKLLTTVITFQLTG